VIPGGAQVERQRSQFTKSLDIVWECSKRSAACFSLVTHFGLSLPCGGLYKKWIS